MRALLAIGAAGLVDGVSGFLKVSAGAGRNVVRAGGALAIALGIYVLNPPPIADATETRSKTSQDNGKLFSGETVVGEGGQSASE